MDCQPRETYGAQNAGSNLSDDFLAKRLKKILPIPCAVLAKPEEIETVKANGIYHIALDPYSIAFPWNRKPGPEVNPAIVRHHLAGRAIAQRNNSA
jgi:hypothetical protein